MTLKIHLITHYSVSSCFFYEVQFCFGVDFCVIREVGEYKAYDRAVYITASNVVCGSRFNMETYGKWDTLIPTIWVSLDSARLADK